MPMLNLNEFWPKKLLSWINLAYFFSFQPPPGAWDHTVDDREHTVEQWKDLIYQEVIDYERSHNVAGPGGSANRGAVSGVVANTKVDGEDEVMQHTAAAAAATGGRR